MSCVDRVSCVDPSYSGGGGCKTTAPRDGTARTLRGKQSLSAIAASAKKAEAEGNEKRKADAMRSKALRLVREEDRKAAIKAGKANAKAAPNAKAKNDETKPRDAEAKKASAVRDDPRWVKRRPQRGSPGLLRSAREQSLADSEVPPGLVSHALARTRTARGCLSGRTQTPASSGAGCAMTR